MESGCCLAGINGYNVPEYYKPETTDSISDYAVTLCSVLFHLRLVYGKHNDPLNNSGCAASISQQENI